MDCEGHENKFIYSRLATYERQHILPQLRQGIRPRQPMLCAATGRYLRAHL